MSILVRKVDFGMIYESRVVLVDGAYFWESVMRPVPVDCAAEYGVDKLPDYDPVVQKEANKAHADKVISEYIALRAELTLEQKLEEEYERRAAFGPGESVIDIFTGERWNT